MNNIMEFNEKKRPKAVVGVMVWKNKKVLLGKRKGSHGAGEYSFPGGHMEYGESFKDSVLRETFEESGVRINNLKFICVANIDKYNYQVVLIGMTGDWESGGPITNKKERIGEWGWYDLNNLPKPLFFSTNLLIDSYKSGINYYDKE